MNYVLTGVNNDAGNVAREASLRGFFISALRATGYVTAGLIAVALLAAAGPARSLAAVSPATGVVGGRDHTCALTAGGAVECWGRNGYGQLGNGTTNSSSVPVDVGGLGSGIRAIAAGGYHSCAVTGTGAVRCWGRNDHGQLGNGTTVDSSTSVDVVGLTGVIALIAGDWDTCARTSAGAVKCWGSNEFGELGDGSGIDQHIPVDVVGLTSGVQALAAGAYHACAVTSAGGVKCWGANNFGQLGDGTQTGRPTPVDVSGLSSGVVAVTAGLWHSCAQTGADGAKCWGANFDGQVGDGTQTERDTPVDVSGLASGVQAIAVGGNHSCALVSGGAVECWGDNKFGEVGDGTLTERDAPVDVSGLGSGAVAIAAGYFQACALMSGSSLECWGLNRSGQLGDGSIQFGTPVDVAGLASGVQAISTGLLYSCALTSSGGAKCWGWNNLGQLGDGTTDSRSTPVNVFGLASDVASISAGNAHTCAVTAPGGAKCWGGNAYGELGDGTTDDSAVPVDVSGLTTGVVAIAASVAHSCALTNGAGVKCWGWNAYGQLGDGTNGDSWTPVDVMGLSSGVAAIAVGDYHSCALLDTGGLKCWGGNFWGQLGDGTTSDSSSPVDVSGLASGVGAITAGSGHSCALTSAGGAKCWGGNSDGQLGDGTTSNRSSRGRGWADKRRCERQGGRGAHVRNHG